MEALKLNLPKALVDVNDTQELDLEQLRTWLLDLAITNTSQSCQQMIALLQQQNQIKIKPEIRFQSLNLIRPVAKNLIDILRNHYLRAFLPLSEKNLKCFSCATHLINELACGYRLITQEIVANQQFQKDKDKQQLAISTLYLSIEHLGDIMLEYSICYYPIPKIIFKEINQLYLFSIKNNLNQISIPCPSHPDCLRTIAYVYKAVMLLSIVNPHHLMHGEAIELKNLIVDIAGRCPIHKIDINNKTLKGYIINLESDACPRYVPSGNLIASEQNYLFEIEPFLNLLQGKLKNIQNDNNTNQKNNANSLELSLEPIDTPVKNDNEDLDLLHRIFRDMYSRVIDTLNRRLERNHERSHCIGAVEMTFGLSSTHYTLSKQENFNPELDEVKIHTGKRGASLSSMSLLPADYEHWRADESKNRIDEGIQKPRTSIFDEEQEAFDTWNKIYVNQSKSKDQKDKINALRKYNASAEWKLKNLSAGGLCVFCIPENSLAICVGELVAYQTPDSQDWWVGLVRWLRLHNNSTIEIGLMHLHKNTFCVAARAIKGTGCGGEYFRALFTEKEIQDKYNTIILPTAVFDQQTELVVNFGDELAYIKLSQIILTTKSISQFRFEIISAPEIEIESIVRLKTLL